MRKSSAGRAALGFGLAYIVLVMNAVVGCYNTYELHANDHRVAETSRRLGAFEALLSTLKDAETGQRGYIITGAKDYLQPYEAARERIPQQLADLESLGAGNVGQRERLTQLQQRVLAKLEELKEAIDARDKGFEAAQQLIRTDRGKQVMDDIRELSAALKRDERARLLVQQASSRQSYLIGLGTEVVAVVLCLGMLYVAFALVQRELQARRRAEAEAHTQREWCMTILASIGDAVIVTDAAGRIQFLNSVAQVITEWNEEAVGKDLTEVFRVLSEATREAVESPVNQVCRTGKVIGQANHTLLLTRRGREVPIDDSAAPIRARDGALTGVVLVFRDITERRSMELEVQRREHEFATLAEHSPDIIFRLDRELRHLYISPAVEKATGRKCEEFLGKTGLEAGLAPNPWSAFEASCRAALGSDRPVTMELSYESPHGRRHYESRIVAERRPDGGVRSLLGVTRDITERRRYEEALRDADRRKDEFLATLAHELRNPLAPIRNAVQVLYEKDIDDPHIRQAREVIDRQLKQLTRLVDDLLDVSRITHGQVILQLQPTELAPILTTAVETSRPLLDARHHQWEVEVLPEAVRVEADPTRLSQVFANLLNNAAKYTEPGGRIRLRAEREDREIVVRVSDTGVGIAADMLPKVFDLFTQAEQTIDRAQGGLGIGLTLVRRLVELHHGSVTALSAGPGRGSEFVVRLPILTAPPAPTAVAAPPAVDQQPGRRILVVDDNEDSAESLAMVLRLLGHEVQTVYDGPTALEAALRQQPEIILLDIGLPGLDGLEVARRLRLDYGLIDAVLIAMTGYGQDEDRRRSLEAGFNAHLVKPVDFGELRQLLAEA
jgi:PAS domain S-box-containing protein